MRSPELAGAVQVGPRLFLRPPAIGDEQEIIERNRASRALHRGWVAPPTDHGAFLQWMRRLEDPSTRGYLLCRRQDGAIVGAFVLSQIVRRGFQSAYLGYYALRPFDRQGFMTEGLQLLLRQVFAALKLHRVEANIQPENVASLALVKRAGFRLEGFSPRYLKIAGRWRDHERWAMLVDDWQRLVKRRPPRAPSPGRSRRSRRGSASPGRGR